MYVYARDALYLQFHASLLKYLFKINKFSFFFFDVGLQNISSLIKCLCKTNNKRIPKI